MMTSMAWATTMIAFFLAVRAAVAAPFHDVPVVEGLEVAVVADGCPGAFGQDRLEMLVAVAGFAGAAFPGGFVVARADPGPGGQVGGVAEELGDVRPDLGDHRGGGQRADPGGGGQQVPLGVKGRHHRLDLRVQLSDHLIEVADVVQVQAAHQGMMVTEPAFQRHGQVRDLGAHLAPGQVGQHSGAAFPVDQRLAHRPAGLGGDG